MEIFLSVFFFDSQDQPFLREEWLARPQPSLEVCEERKINIENYLLNYGFDDEKFIVMCGTADEIEEKYYSLRGIEA